MVEDLSFIPGRPLTQPIPLPTRQPDFPGTVLDGVVSMVKLSRQAETPLAPPLCVGPKDTKERIAINGSSIKLTIHVKFHPA